MCDTVHENAKYINVLVLQKQLLTKHDERKKDYKALFTFKISTVFIYNRLDSI